MPRAPKKTVSSSDAAAFEAKFLFNLWQQAVANGGKVNYKDVGEIMGLNSAQVAQKVFGLKKKYDLVAGPSKKEKVEKKAESSEKMEEY